MGRRIIKAAPDSLAGLDIGENAVRLSGNTENLIYVDGSGVYIVGPISILTEAENIRVATNYTFPTTYQCTLPSTTVNPQPILVEQSPIQGFTSLAEEVARLLGELV